MDSYKITFNEVDFILPSYRYNIQFSFTTKQGLPFIREYILRIVQLGSMLPNQIATYFDLNEREAREAISDLIQREELRYDDQNRIELTEKSQGYFESLGSPLNVSVLRSSGANLGFELTSLTCVSTQKKRLAKEWTQGFRLDVASSKIANRDRLISKAFQRHFQDLIDDGYMDHIKDKEGGKPNIYKVESLNQIGSDPVRLKIGFEMDIDGNAIETDDLDELKDSSEALELVASVINKNARRGNHLEVLNAIESLGDRHTSNLFSPTKFKVNEFVNLKSSDISTKSKHIPILGSLYSHENWKTFSDLLDKEKKRIISKHQDGLAEFKWLIPSDPFWGKSDLVKARFTELVNGASTTGKKSKSLYDLKFFTPVSSAENRREYGHWLHELEFVKKQLHGYIEGYLDGLAEVILLEDRLVAVTYYLNMPDSYRVPVPIGFISTDSGVINTVTQSLNGYLAEFHDQEHRKDLGALTGK